MGLKVVLIHTARSVAYPALEPRRKTLESLPRTASQAADLFLKRAEVSSQESHKQFLGLGVNVILYPLASLITGPVGTAVTAYLVARMLASLGRIAIENIRVIHNMTSANTIDNLQ